MGKKELVEFINRVIPKKYLRFNDTSLTDLYLPIEEVKGFKVSNKGDFMFTWCDFTMVAKRVDNHKYNVKVFYKGKEYSFSSVFICDFKLGVELEAPLSYVSPLNPDEVVSITETLLFHLTVYYCSPIGEEVVYYPFPSFRLR